MLPQIKMGEIDENRRPRGADFLPDDSELWGSWTREATRARKELPSFNPCFVTACTTRPEADLIIVNHHLSLRTWR